MAKLSWRKQKTLAMLANRRQYQREFDPSESAEYEIQLEHNNNHLVIESSQPATPNYIITE